MRSFVSLALALLFGGPFSASAAADPDDLKISRIALFSSGVGFFQCEADVTDASTAELRFRTAQINDILKSLVVQDLDGGSISVVGYPSQEPIDRALKSFGVDITGKPTLAQLLDQLRGEAVRIAGSQSLDGLIVGVEKQRVVLDDKNVVDFDVLNVLTDAGLRQLRFSDLAGVKFANEKVDAELRKALATLAASHDADKKSVTIEFTGKGQRRVRASYLVEAPIWKTSYRLVLDDKTKPFLQGWAMVENTTEEDWKDVRLSLVAGRPISFTMDLYSPIYVPRPKEELELYTSLRPPTPEGVFTDVQSALPPPAAAARLGKRSAGRGGTATIAGVAGDLAMTPDVDKGLAEAIRDSGVQSVATAEEAGELYEYSIKTPVSIPRRQSAMLPIVNQEVTGQKVSLFNPANHPKHPLNALELHNTTGLNLMQGPVTLFDGNVYAGDAKLPDLRPDEKRLVAYALDLAMEVRVDSESQPGRIVSLRIAKGTLWHKTKYVDERTYVVRNKDAKDRTLLIEQPFSSDWTLVEPKDPFERTAHAFRFKVNVPAGKSVSQPVRLERVPEESVILSNTALNTITYYLRAKSISSAVKQALERLASLRNELDRLLAKRETAERDLETARSEQARIRENLKTLQGGGDAHARQLKKFDEFENQIERLSAELSDSRAQERKQVEAIDDYLLGLNVE